MEDAEMLQQEPFKSMMAAAFSPEIQTATAGVRAIAHFDISEAQVQPFLRFHSFITQPQPRFITEWREDPKREHRYRVLVDGVLTHVRGALSAVEYHRANLVDLETELNTFLESVDFKKVLGGSTMGIGGTAKLDFEYQAYILAYRRCLDYLTRALATYFGRPNHSFREMRTKALHRAKPETVADALSEVHEKFAPLFGFVMTNEGDTSVRDRIAHTEGVGAGCINLSRMGVYLAGGGEDLRGWGPEGGKLSEALAIRTVNLHECVGTMLDAFIGSAMKVEQLHEGLG